MLPTYSSWRDRQLSGFVSLKPTSPIILHQEQVMLDFLASCPNINWCWQGDESNFKQICSELYSLNNKNYNGVILFGKSLMHLTTSQLIDKIKMIINDVEYAYIGINRYQLGDYDLEISLPDDIGDSIDVIMKLIHPKFKRLYTHSDVDGNHMVAAHPMDCYGLCK